ncbi:unnamed protein product [Gadus morhua 'NCC']
MIESRRDSCPAVRVPPPHTLTLPQLRPRELTRELYHRSEIYQSGEGIALGENSKWRCFMVLFRGVGSESRANRPGPGTCREAATS